MSPLLCLILFVGAAQSESPRTIVERMWSQYNNLVVRHDTDALADLYAEDARLMAPNADDVVGRQTIRLVLKTVFAQRVRPIDARFVPREVVHYNGVIYDQGDYIETVAPVGDPRRATDVYGRYFAVWAEQPDGAWKLARVMWAPKQQPAR